MPVINDAVVVNQPYQTSASARPQQLSNGWLISVELDGTTSQIKIQVSKDKMATTPTQLCFISNVTNKGFSVASKGTKIYVFFATVATTISYVVIDAITQANVDLYPSLKLADQGLNDSQSNNAIIDGNDIHFVNSSKIPAYPNSFNIRYAKGTINADGSVGWGAVEQRSTMNSNGYNQKNPTIVVINGNPIIIVDYNESIIFHRYNGSNWGVTQTLYTVGNFTQSSPSAIFVPQSINGLANGRIWVAWSGRDGTAGTLERLMVSYSDDGGLTWSVPTKVSGIVTRGYFNISITANRNNDIFVLANTPLDAKFSLISYKLPNGGTWSSETIIKQGTLGDFENPSSLYDLSISMSSPIFIYTDKSASKVGFYGSWTNTISSVPQGSIGQKTNKDNFLPYSITTDGTMSTITEKINGVTVGTKTATSGQSLSVSLTQAQWDAIKYGKYCEQTLITYNNPSDWEQGTINGANNESTSSDTGIRKRRYLVNGNNNYQFEVKEGYKLLVQQLNDKVYYPTANSGYFTGIKTIKMLSDTVAVNILIAKVDDSVITPNGVILANLTIKDLASFPKNTLTIEMGTEKWTYTFDKQLPANADLLSAAKASMDAATVSEPAKKALLAGAVRSKGRVVNDSDSLEAIATAIGGILPRKEATGTITLYSNNPAVISGLDFDPSYVLLTTSPFDNTMTSANTLMIHVKENLIFYAASSTSYSSQVTHILKNAITSSKGGVSWNHINSNGTFTWKAWV